MASDIVRRFRESHEWWSFVAQFFGLPTAGAVVIALKDRATLSSLELYLLALGVLAYWVILVIEATPYIDAIGPRDRARLEFARTARAMLTDSKSDSFYIAEAWFRNRPYVSTEKFIAHRVTATVDIYGVRGWHLNVIGQWLLSKAPTYVGFTDMVTAVDIPPNDEPAKLGIAVKRSKDPSGYVVVAETLHRGFVHPDFAIPLGKYRVVVTLAGVGVKRQEFKFLLVNDPLEVQPALDPVHEFREGDIA